MVVSLNPVALYSFSFEDFVVDLLGLEFARHHREMISTNLRERFVCYCAARGHGKSMMNAVAYALWLVFRSVEPVEVMIVSGTETQVKKIISSIKHFILSVPLLRKRLFKESSFREAGVKSFSALKIILKGGHVIHGFSATSKSILGNHVNFLIVDDVYGEEVSDIETINQYFENNIRPTINTKKGQLVFVGTRKHQLDFFNRIKQKGKAKTGFVYKEFPAVVTDSKGNWLRPLWSSRFSLDELKQIKESMSLISWEREYMLNVVSEDFRLFPSNLVESCIIDDLNLREVNSESQYFLGADIALSSSARSDFTVFVILEKTVDGKLFVVDLKRFKGKTTSELLNVLVNLHSNYNFSRILIEDAPISKGFVEECVSNEFLSSVVDSFVTTQKSKEELLSKLEISMRNKKLFFPRFEQLIKELLFFGVKTKKGKQKFEGLGEHDDCVMALGFAVKASEVLDSFSFEFIDYS